MRLLMIVREDFAFLQHRLPIARAASKIGYEVHILTKDNGRLSEISNKGFVAHRMVALSHWTRIFSLPLTLMQWAIVMWKVKPQIIHLSSTTISILGAFAGLAYRPVPTIIAFTGLGYLFTTRNRFVRFLLKVMGPSIAWLWNRPHIFPLFQNNDDIEKLSQLRLSTRPAKLLPGAGVNCELFKPGKVTLGESNFVVGCGARLIRDKGIRYLVEAMALLENKAPQIRLKLAGAIDPGNPGAFKNAEIETWRGKPNVEFMGAQTDMPGFWRSCNAAILVSRREGMPKALLEAAATGLPIITTDVAGCRELVEPGVNGILISTESPQEIADAILALANDREFCAEAGKQSRALIKQRGMDETAIGHGYQSFLKQIIEQ